MFGRLLIDKIYRKISQIIVVLVVIEVAIIIRPVLQLSVFIICFFNKNF
jgi:hypothetical protein